MNQSNENGALERIDTRKPFFNAAQRLGRLALGLAEVGGGLVTMATGAQFLGYMPVLGVPAIVGGIGLVNHGAGHIIEAFGGEEKPATPGSEHGAGRVIRSVVAVGEMACGFVEATLGAVILSTGVGAPLGVAVMSSGFASVGEGLASFHVTDAE